MEWTNLMYGQSVAVGSLEFVGTDNRIKKIVIYAFKDEKGNPSYYDVAYNDKEEFEASDPKDWLDSAKNPTTWLTDGHKDGSFEDALVFVRNCVRDMGCDDTITNDDLYKLKVKGGERAFFIANGMIYSAGCMCAAVDTPDGSRKHYSMWMKPEINFTEDLVFVTKEEAESHLGDDKFDIGKLGLLNGEEIRDFSTSHD